jgi:o-succinylbenzoate synthase
MKIIKLTVDPITIRYKFDFTTAYGTEREAYHALVRVYADDGTIGLGEAAPLTDFTGENYQTVKKVVTEKFSKALLDLDPFDHTLIHSRLDKIPGNAAAKASVDIALYDLMGKSLSVPVHRFIGGKLRPRIEVAEVIGIDTPPHMADSALNLKKQGFRTIKMKVGSGKVLEDVKRVAAVRDAIGTKVDLRVDANNSYSVEKATQLGRKIKRYELAYLEQPVSAKNLAGLAKVRRKTGVPITADEAVHTSRDALKVIKHDAADNIAIKFAKCGGICEAKAIANIASAAGLKCVLISAFEIGIGVAANIHVACSSASIELPCEIGIGPEYDDEITTGLENGLTWMGIPTRPGLGIEVLNRY